MGRNPACTVYIGNLDEKVSEQVLYEVLIQVGHLVDLHMPRDKKSNHHKGYAFAEYETKEIAEYAVRLFSGLVCLHNRTLKFAMSGQAMPSQNQAPLSPHVPNSALPNPHPMNAQDTEISKGSLKSGVNCRIRGAQAEGLANDPGISNFGYSRRVIGSLLNNVSRPVDKHSDVNSSS